MMLYFAKNRKLKMFPVQIQWEFASAVPFEYRGWVKHSGGTAPNQDNG